MQVHSAGVKDAEDGLIGGFVVWPKGKRTQDDGVRWSTRFSMRSWR